MSLNWTRELDDGGSRTTGQKSKSKISFGKISLKPATSVGSSEDVPPESSSGGWTSTSTSSPSDPTNTSHSTTTTTSMGFGSFSWTKEGQGSSEEAAEEESVEDISKMMGFAGFSTTKKELGGSKKSAKVFDLKEMVKEARNRAKKEMSGDVEDEPSKESLSEVKTDEDKDDSDEDLIGPMPPPPQPPASSSKSEVKKTGDDEDDDEDLSSSDEESEESIFPISERMELSHGTRPVSALSVDAAGTRFATGSYDYEVKMWDFASLKNRHAYRAIRPCESHPIVNVSYSSSGDSLLVIGGNAQAKVFDRDGTELLECTKGDQYIVDMARTKGHVAALTGGQFNPKQKNIFLTSSDDGTCRLWDVNKTNPREHTTIVKLKSASGLKNRVTTCCFGRDGYTFLGAGFDGNFSIWDTRRPLVVPTYGIKGAHTKGTETFSVVYSHSGLQLGSRGEDGVVNIWDTRNLKSVLWKSDVHPAKYKTTDLTFSPDDRYLLIPSLPEGTTGRTKDEVIKYSTLHFLSTSDFTYSNQRRLNGQIIIRTAWHHRLNQILLTFASGGAMILYDVQRSVRGAMLSHGKVPKTNRNRDMVEDLTNKIIITPNALPMFKADKPRNSKRDEMKARMDPVRSRRPDLPITAGTGGRVSTSGSTLSSYVIRNLGLSKSVKDDMDPREAILRYAKEAEEDPIWVTPAYKATQPKAIFASEEEESAAEASDAKKRKLL